MSRRDTIIIAVLVNAALLMVLFATAMRSDKPENQLAQADLKPHNRHDEFALAENMKPQDKEELLNEFVISVPPFADSPQENYLSFEESLPVVPTAPAEVKMTPSSPMAIPQAAQEVRSFKPQAEESFVHVTVKKGDFLEKIAKGNNTTVAAIMKVNNLSTTQLKVGQVLKIPLTEGKKQESLSPSIPVLQNGEYYVVKEGDNPWLIASRNRLKLEELLRLNNLDEQKAKRLRPGDKLRIR